MMTINLPIIFFIIAFSFTLLKAGSLKLQTLQRWDYRWNLKESGEDDTGIMGTIWLRQSENWI